MSTPGSGKQTELPTPIMTIHDVHGTRTPLPPKVIRQLRFSWKGSKLSEVINQAEEWMARAGEGLMIGYFGITAHQTTAQPKTMWHYKTSTLLIDMINQKDDTGTLATFIKGLVNDVMKLSHTALTTGSILAMVSRTTLDIEEAKEDLNAVYIQREAIEYAVKHAGVLPVNSLMQKVSEMSSTSKKKKSGVK